MIDLPTPETDAEHAQFAMGGFTLDFCRKLERERDEAREDLEFRRGLYKVLEEANNRLMAANDEARAAIIGWENKWKCAVEMAAQAEVERDEAREALAEWHDSALHVRQEYEDEQHCSCVPILRKLLKDAERERDEARGERDALRDAVNALHDYVHGKRNDDKDISEILNGAMKI